MPKQEGHEMVASLAPQCPQLGESVATAAPQL